MPRTHYDNLQVSRTAGDCVIRAAYKSLSQQWHPDKHPNDVERAEKISKIINEAYRVLSDPMLRKEHDAWIAREAQCKSQETAKVPASRPPPQNPRSVDGESIVLLKDILNRWWELHSSARIRIGNKFLRKVGLDDVVSNDDRSLYLRLQEVYRSNSNI
jgi:curved DNA-binding protein CbpA